MPGRFEYKYLVPDKLRDEIRAAMRPYVKVDPFAAKQGKNEYTVRSVYYDTHDFSCYDEKHAGVKVRKKFRIRGYDTPGKDSVVFLEIKRKYNNNIEKNRAPMLAEDLATALEGGNIDDSIISFSGNGKEKKDAQRFLYHYNRRRLRPAVLVIYDREPFFSKFDPKVRLTFDKNVRSTLFPSLGMLYKEHQIKYAMPGHFILEVKFFTGLPHWILRILERYQLKRMALSKYTICLDSHNGPRKFRYGLTVDRSPYRTQAPALNNQYAL
ncbi:MAG: polyphosphate polymerase domain-containing protein [Bacteroidota bacterium]